MGYWSREWGGLLEQGMGWAIGAGDGVGYWSRGWGGLLEKGMGWAIGAGDGVVYIHMWVSMHMSCGCCVLVGVSLLYLTHWTVLGAVRAHDEL